MKRSIAAAPFAIVALAALAACATTEATAPLEVQYAVVKPDASIPFSSSVRNFRVGLDRSLLLEGPSDRWYRATVSEPCRSDLRWSQEVGLADRSSSSVSKFTEVIVQGRRCQIQTLDEIADPNAAEDAARAAAPKPVT